MDEKYLLTTPMAQRLYFETAKQLPLIDYHNHLSAADIAADRHFSDVAEIWLLGDPYKHRAMRICGVPEELISGGAGHMEKFKAWCEVYPKLMGGPLYDWSRMELEEVFGVKLQINGENAEAMRSQPAACPSARSSSPVFPRASSSASFWRSILTSTRAAGISPLDISSTSSAPERPSLKPSAA